MDCIFNQLLLILLYYIYIYILAFNCLHRAVTVQIVTVMGLCMHANLFNPLQFYCQKHIMKTNTYESKSSHQSTLSAWKNCSSTSSSTIGSCSCLSSCHDAPEFISVCRHKCLQYYTVRCMACTCTCMFKTVLMHEQCETPPEFQPL